MHDFEWQESDRAITIRCRLPLLRRLFLSVVLLGYLFWVGVLLLSFLWNLGASPTGGIPWRFVWLLQQTLPAALAAGNLLSALLLAWITIHSALFTPETTLRFDKQARLLTISQVAPASRPRTITVPFNAIQGVSVELWSQGAFSQRPNRWFLEIRCRDGRRFRTPATTENSRILESCALRIRLGALTTQTVGVSHPPQGYFSGYGIVLMVLLVCLVFFSTTYSPLLSDQVLHQNGALVTARVQNKSPIDRDSMLIRYAFVLPSGREINAIRDVHPELMSKLQEGDLMAVRYDRNQPKRNMVVGEGRGRVTPYLFVNLLWLFGLVLRVGGDFDQASPGKPWGLGPRNGWC
jgi:hypothetical protein